MATTVSAAGNGAVFSDDRVYRYELTRRVHLPHEHLTSPTAMTDWDCPRTGSDRSLMTLVAIGLNPSTADETTNDPTIRRLIAFAMRWRMGRFIMLNAYAFRATEPKKMFAAKKAGVDIIGRDNDKRILDAISEVPAHGGMVLAMWGSNIEPERQAELGVVLDQAEVYTLGMTTSRKPKHCLYIAGDTHPVRWLP